MTHFKQPIGLLFGSFNPIHLGHLTIAKFIMEDQKLHEIWFIVSPQNPFKEQNLLINRDHRYNMVKLAIENEPRFNVSDIEFSMPTPSYTYKTFQKLHTLYPGNDFQLIMGSDNLDSFLRWKNVDEIIKEHPILVYPRTGSTLHIPDKLIQCTTITSAPEVDVSSTLIRSHLKNGIDVSTYLSIEVYKYIKMHKLYN